jgi:hypothetical protein
MENMHPAWHPTIRRSTTLSEIKISDNRKNKKPIKVLHFEKTGLHGYR